MPYTRGTAPRIFFEIDDPVGNAEPLVLIEGLSAQLIGWREGFLDELRRRGFRLIRLDNRAVGLSDKLGEPGDRSRRYSVADMAHDVRVLDAAGLGSAHIVGQSMGGAIAQALAIAHRDRVRSLALFYTAPAFDGRYLGEAVVARQALPPGDPAATRGEAVEARLMGERLCTPAGMFFDEAWVRELAGLAWDRCPRIDGSDRQLAALLETADHRSRLGELEIEPPRVCRRPWVMSHAAISMLSAAA